jgi:uncharacterized protein
VSAGSVLGRGIAFPPRLGEDGRWAWSEGAENIREAIRVVLMTVLHERVRRPGFGTELRRLLFQPNIAATHRLMEEEVRQALERWEPRVRLESVSAAARRDVPQAAELTITYALVVSGEREQVNLTLQLAG